MITGVETAGLVLAALPLIISAVEDYKRGWKPIQRIAFTWRDDLDRLIRCLQTQEFFFRIHLTCVIRAAASTEHNLKGLEDVEKALTGGSMRGSVERYLLETDSLPVFDGIIGDYRGRLEEAVEHLRHINRPASTSNDLREIVKANPAVDGQFSFKKRFKFTLKHEKLSDLVKDLDQCNSNFRHFVSSIEGYHEHGQKNPSKSEDAKILAGSLHQFREHAQELYVALTTGGIAACHPSQEAMLILETRSAIAEAVAEVPAKPTPQFTSSFRMVLTTKSTGSHQRALHETQVTILDDKRLRLVDTCNRLEAAGAAEAAAPMELGAGKKLLCDDIAACSTCLRFLQASDVVSLEQLLLARYRLTSTQRTVLALNLASSILQLHTTNWFGETWTKKAIKFFQRQISGTSTIAADTPFILRSYPRALHPSNRNSVKRDMLELGILLLEIWQQQTFEAWTTTKQLAMQTEYSPRMVLAIQWLEATTDDLTACYADAVSVCVKFSFEGVQQRDWGNPAFRRLYCERVIGFLQENYKAWVRAV